MTTPGQLRQFASQAEKDVIHYRQRALTIADPHWKRYYERCADNREDDARWYREYASRGEIEIDYIDLDKVKEAAE